jgi:hypothetical protein
MSAVREFRGWLLARKTQTLETVPQGKPQSNRSLLRERAGTRVSV